MPIARSGLGFARSLLRLEIVIGYFPAKFIFHGNTKLLKFIFQDSFQLLSLPRARNRDAGSEAHSGVVPHKFDQCHLLHCCASHLGQRRAICQLHTLVKGWRAGLARSRAAVCECHGAAVGGGESCQSGPNLDVTLPPARRFLSVAGTGNAVGALWRIRRAGNLVFDERVPLGCRNNKRPFKHAQLREVEDQGRNVSRHLW